MISIRKENKHMLYILEERHMSRGVGEYLLAVEAETAEEAEKMANEYVKHDKRVLNIPLCPLFKVKMDAYKSMCPVVITKDNFQKVLNENPYKK
jgi:hypothetical protein